jgi:ferrous-iron efflux pump FieF
MIRVYYNKQIIPNKFCLLNVSKNNTTALLRAYLVTSNEMENQVKNVNAENDYNYWVRFAAIAATSTALLLVVIKLYAWFATGASAMLASTTDSMLDLFASLMNVVILRFALAPADDEHKFGHGKAESLAGLTQAAFVLGSAILLLINGVDRFITPKQVVQTEIGIIVTVIAIIATLALVLLQKQVIKRTSSLAISADAMHYQSDLLLNIGVLLALFLSQGLWLRADGFFTILVGAYLLWGAANIIWLSVQHLMDHQLTDEEQQQVLVIALRHDKVLGLHDLRTRQAGQQRFIQFHLELDDHLSLFEAHAIGEDIEHEIMQALAPCEVFIHHDPVSTVGDDVERTTRVSAE